MKLTAQQNGNSSSNCIQLVFQLHAVGLKLTLQLIDKAVYHSYQSAVSKAYLSSIPINNYNDNSIIKMLIRNHDSNRIVYLAVSACV